MKKIVFLFASAIFSLALVSCSSSSEPDLDPEDEPNVIDKSILEGVSRSEMALKYNISSSGFFQYVDGGEDQEIDTSLLDGMSCPTPASIIFQNDRILFEELLFSSATGPDPVLVPLQAYKKSTGKSFDVFIAEPLKYDEATNYLTINDLDFSVISLTKKTLKLSDKARKLANPQQYEGRFGIRYYTIDYTAVNFTPIDLEKNLIGSDLNDIRRQIIDLCREHFGNTIDLTEVFDGSVHFDAGNIIDLDQLERQLGL